jgi:RNA polymerase sigma factor (TIGR02999 family)
MERSSDDTVSRLLEAVQRGDRCALDELYSLVYSELRVLAHRQRRRWDASGMLNTTALVHEAYLKLVKQRAIHLVTRAHLFALAATAIRHIVSNYARDRQARKRQRCSNGVAGTWGAVLPATCTSATNTRISSWRSTKR